jgi:hypothetical protein
MGQNPGKSQPEGEISRFCDIPGLGMGPKKGRGWVSGERMAEEGWGNEGGGGYQRLWDRWSGIVCIGGRVRDARTGVCPVGGVSRTGLSSPPGLPSPCFSPF